MGRSFMISGFGPGSSAVGAETRERIEKTEAARTLAMRGLLESDLEIPGAGGETYKQRAERLGIDEASLGNATKFLRRLGTDEPVSAKYGQAAPMQVRGETFQSADSWVDGHGDTITEAYRSVGGRRLERILVREERVSERTRVAKGVRIGSRI